MDKADTVDAPDTKRLTKAVANLYLSSAAGVYAIFAERNAANKSNESLPPFIPHHLMALSHS